VFSGADSPSFNLLQMQTEMHIMLRVRASLLALSIGLVSLNTANAGWHEFWHRVHLDFHRNNCWDEPFTSIDRRAARVPFVNMVHSGWRTQNTLGQHYFHPETQVLNEAGERKLYWIVTNAPEQYRTIYVAGTHESGVVEQRVDAVQQALVKLVPDQPLPAVIPAKNEPRGWPAEYIDTIDRKVHASIPNPRLPTFRSAGSMGG
jgi:hypothetical protein